MWECVECKKLGTDYIQKPTKLYVACDNTDGDFWVEEFHTLKECLGWLNDEFEV